MHSEIDARLKGSPRHPTNERKVTRLSIPLTAAVCFAEKLTWIGPGQAGVAGDPGSRLLRSPGRWMSCEALVKHISKVAQPAQPTLA